VRLHVLAQRLFESLGRHLAALQHDVGLRLHQLLVVRSAGRGNSAGFGMGMSPWEYLRAQFGWIIHYLDLSIWPQVLVLVWIAIVLFANARRLARRLSRRLRLR
jgi:hypothetical protein